MASIKLFGQIKRIGNEEIFGENGFKKRELIIKTVEQYPTPHSIDFTQGKCDLLNDFKVGDNVAVNVNLRGNEYIKEDGTEVVFNSIQGWKIELLHTQTPNSAVEQYQAQAHQTDNAPY